MNMTLAIKLTETISEYMSHRYETMLLGHPAPVSYPEDWDMSLLHECNLAVNILLEAHQNKKITSWSVTDYVDILTERCTGQNLTVEEDLKKCFPPIYNSLATVVAPCIVTDSAGRILVWYLPGILTQKCSDQMWRDLKKIEPTLHIAVHSENWRVGPTYFRTLEGWLKPGNANMAIAWFQQAHEKSNPLEVSADLRKPASLIWLETQLVSSAIIGGILSIIHPEMYRSGITMIEEVHKNQDLVAKSENIRSILKLWSAPFGVISVISNRDTPYHRDNGADHSWYDVLTPLGEYHDGRIELPGIGMRFGYDPGSLFAFTGRVLQHGVNCVGDRAVVAYYAKRHVLSSLHIPSASWSFDR